jgi:hypothetical protein
VGVYIYTGCVEGVFIPDVLRGIYTGCVEGVYIFTGCEHKEFPSNVTRMAYVVAFADETGLGLG